MKKKKDDTGAYLHVRNAAVMTLVRVYPQAVVLAYTKWGEVGTKKKKKKAQQTRICTPGIEEDGFVHCFLNCQGTVRHLWTSSVPSDYSGGARKRL